MAVYSQSENLVFSRALSFEQLASHAAYDLAIDEKGFLWIAASGGVFRYDGSRMKNYSALGKGTPGRSCLQEVNALYFAKGSRTLWVLGKFGLGRFEPEQDQFKPYILAGSGGVSRATAVHESEGGMVWALNHANELFRYEPIADTFLKVTRLETPERHLAYCLIATEQEVILGADRGLIRYAFQTDRTEYLPVRGVASQIPIGKINAMVRTGDSIWFGGFDYDLGCYNLKSGKISHFPIIEGPMKAIFRMSVMQDTLWLGAANGLYALDLCSKRVKWYAKTAFRTTKDAVMSTVSDLRGRVWFLVEHEGLFKAELSGNWTPLADSYPEIRKWDFLKGSQLHLTGDWLWITAQNGSIGILKLGSGEVISLQGTDPRMAVFQQGTIFKVFQDQAGRIWVGSLKAGLQRYLPETGRFISYLAGPQTGIRGNDIRDITSDEKGQLYLAVHGRGIDRFDPSTGKVNASWGYCIGDSMPYISDWPLGLLHVSDQELIIRASDGLQLINGQKKAFLQHHPSDSLSLPDDHVMSLAQDHRGKIWVGTAAGLALWDKGTKFLRLNLRNQGPEPIESLFVDRNETLWASMHGGVYAVHWDESVRHWKSVSLSGLLGKPIPIIHSLSNASDAQGYAYALCGSELYRFMTEIKLKPGKSEPDLYFESLKTGAHEIQLNNLKRVKLPANQRDIAVSFGSIWYEGPIYFRYRLEGLDEDWIAGAQDQIIRYRNLPGGSFQLALQVSTDGVEFIEATTQKLEIQVSPAPNHAAALWIAGILILIGFIWRMWTRRRQPVSQGNSAPTEPEAAPADAERIQKLVQTSHDLRTPLTLILGPIRGLMARTNDPEALQLATLIERNARRIERISRQMTCAADAPYSVNLYPGNIEGCVEDVFCSFEFMARNFEIGYSRRVVGEAPDESLFDPDLIDQVLSNLLANAFKFTPVGGAIVLETAYTRVSASQTKVEISVIDSGLGINSEDLEHIFDRFFTRNSPLPGREQGMGLGLYLCRELVAAHQGTISVRSAPGKGSTFTVTMPLSGVKPATGGRQPSPLLVARRPIDIKLAPIACRPVILIAEDDPEMGQWIIDVLGESYSTILCLDGAEAEQKALGHSLDLIIADVTMPGQDGRELCRRLRKRPQTSAIPFVFLTSRVGIQDQLAGLACGADDYIGKPFDPELLRARVKQLLLNRRNLVTKYSGELSDVLATAHPAAEDQLLMSQFYEAIEQRLDDPDLEPEALARTLGLSRAQLYRKIKGISGYSVGELMKWYRLRRATVLLRETTCTVSEVADRVGFRHIAHFSHAFKAVYHCTPSQYAQESKLFIE